MQNQQTTADNLDFLHDLYEARMTRDSENQRILTYTDCTERTYLSLLILQLLSQFSTYRQYASQYARQTKKTNYKQFRMYSTDLHNFVYFVTGDDKAMDKLKDSIAAKMLRKRASFPTMAFNRYLGEIGSGLNPSGVLQFFLNVENGLNIRNTDYKTVRREILSYDRLSERDRRMTVTRLLHAARAKLRSSDIIEHLEKLAAIKDYETRTVKDTEPTVSMPDLPIDQNQLAFYRYLVGAPNLMLTKKFLELAVQGKSIPPQFVKAYFPAIKTISPSLLFSFAFFIAFFLSSSIDILLLLKFDTP